ncbi:NADPH--sulfite reductase flavoprotein alpha-component [Gordonia effusa NBRC 100432]|uniref:assimilatory sulfite reductase (NADPH) n=1 Tax=Gordonia effusa NBRC 100432 TaxID=1077974 RepID=H0QVQ9_9ACTN|nr:sulfite reductase subunit alpha [Gordonia effusa]GAB16910.1 NADPH--sulfite reductase flavoprotein alpha-component [Gordonia effusa NBRC 100432]
MQLPYIPADVPFTGDQKAWLAGFLAGLNTRINIAPATPGVPAVAGSTSTADAGPVAIQIVYGSQTGTAEFLAEEAANVARAKGFLPLICGLDELEISTLAAVRRLLVITSTYGEGDMPDNAEFFWQELAAPTAPPLPGLFYSVLALGDSSYDGFCQAGKNIDARLAELGATRVVDRTDCDLDFEDPAAAWTAAAIDALARVDADSAPAVSAIEDTTADAAPSKTPRKSTWNRKNPYRATILANSVLSGPGSDKEVRHVVLSLGDSGITYRPGDGISIAPINDPALVSAVIERLGVSGDTVITDRKGEVTLADALTHRFEISTPSKYLVDYIAQRSQDPELTHLTATGDREALDAWLWGKDVLDLLNIDAALPITPDELLAELRPLQPRVYSISSSPLAHADTVHITMDTVRYRSGGRRRGGVCSTFLADRCEVGSDVGVFISTNNSFRLPDDDTDVVMIGPGTGIAPFRSFLHERAQRGASGRNWLFFGDQHQACDFSYADELDQFSADGVLTRLDLAFSRDQDHKIYVQNRMNDAGAELFSWLDGGAHLYVCGDATRMARDVDAMLHEIVGKHGGFDPAGAQDFINQLKKNKRYVRDVY